MLNNAISATDAAHLRIAKEIGRAKGAPPMTEDEKVESNKARMEAMNSLNSTIALIQGALHGIQKSKAAEMNKQEARSTFSTVNDSAPRAKFSLGAAVSAFPAALAAPPTSPVDSLKKQLSADGLKAGKQTLTQMADAIEPIIDNFDQILVKPYLKNYHASLNTVPVVGIKDNKIMYVETKSTAVGLLKDQWSLFSSLPDNVQIAPNSTNVFLFPYKGDLCLAIGQKVWRKIHRSEATDLAKAINNWPNMYQDNWDSVGDAVLPAADLRGVVPFAMLSAAREDIDFRLVVLKSDSSLAVMTNDELVNKASFASLTFNPSTETPTVPKWSRIAYWDGEIVGYDEANNVYNLQVDFKANTFKVLDKTPDSAVTELTASDFGLVVSRNDGFLYKRIVKVPADANKDATFEWTKWIKQDGVTNLGVASPGVILDLNLLTRTLRSRYIEVQTSVYPIVNGIGGFCTTHKFYLKKLQAAADAYNSATSSEEKKALAISEGKKYVAHAKVWSNIVNTKVQGAKESVNKMAVSLKDVHRQLEIQLTLLNDKLAGLKKTLEVQKEALSKLQAAFWGMVAAMFLGIALAVVGFVFAQPYLIVGAGALFVAGLVAVIALGIKMGEMSSAVSKTEGEIRDVTTAITEMTAIVDSYSALDQNYGVLNMFWGRMQNDAVSIGDMDDATAAQLGMDVLLDDSSIGAADEMTTAMGDACKKYLDVLNKQGIKVPVPTIAMASPTMELGVQTYSSMAVAKAELLPGELNAQFDQLVKVGQSRLVAGDFHGYESTMKQALFTSTATMVASLDTQVASGQWFDVPSLRSHASVWAGSQVLASSTGMMVADPVGLVSQGAKMNGSLGQVRPYVVSMLRQTIQLGKIVLEWSQRFPRPPTKEQASEVAALQQKSLANCTAAQASAAMAKNSFSGFQKEATEYQQGLEMDINRTKGDIQGAAARAESDSNHIDVPWYVYLGGPATVLIYLQVEKAKIMGQYNHTVSSLQDTIHKLKTLQDSGSTLSGHALTWIDMCERVSLNLGSIYNTLEALNGQIMEDPVFYQQLMNTEWSEIVKEASEVLDVIESGSPKSLSAYLMPTGGFAMKLASDVKTSNRTLVKALLPNPNLGEKLKDQAESATQVFDDMEALLRLPNINGIIAYWEQADTKRITLLDVAARLRTQYIQLVATEYDTIHQLHSISILQRFRANNVVKGKLPIDAFVKVSLVSMGQVLTSARRTASNFEKSASEFDFVMTQINANIKEIESKISKLDVDISTAEEKQRNAIISVIADIIALSFSVGILLASFGVIGPVATTLTLAAKLGLGAAATAASIKTVIDSLTLADLVALISAMKSTRRDLRKTADHFAEIQPRFRQIVLGVNAISDSILDMETTLAKVLDNIEILQMFTLTAADVKEIGDSWDHIENQSQAWLDVVNSQGISPATFSIRSSAI
ncbi:hypothetical protein BGZ83_002119 [Gryganskiella cystojenkinii]|nr:hypothetical protein BGZ83_002119 [Gryganskiella cystojenkinii]